MFVDMTMGMNMDVWAWMDMGFLGCEDMGVFLGGCG